MRAGRLDFGAGSARPCARGTKPRRSNVGQTLLSLARSLAHSLSYIRAASWLESRARGEFPLTPASRSAHGRLLCLHYYCYHTTRLQIDFDAPSLFLPLSPRAHTKILGTPRESAAAAAAVFFLAERAEGKSAAGELLQAVIIMGAFTFWPDTPRRVRSRNTHDSLAYFGIPFGLLSVIYAALPAAIVEFLCTLYTYSRAYNSSEKAIQKFQIDWLWLILVASALFDASSVYACFQKRRENSRRDDWIPVRLIVLIYAAARLVSAYIPRVKM